MSPRTRLLLSLPAALVLSCGSRSADEAPASTVASMEEEAKDGAFGGAPPPPPGAPAPKRSANKAEEGRAGAAMPAADAAEPERFAEIREEEAPADKGGAEGEDAAATRAWFPETMLFEPALVTDAQGRAEVPVRVPDRLTTWRILALAHDRQGHQAGAVTSFLGTLPVYVDPVVPPFLVTGDRVELPIQVANTTAADWSGPVRVEVTGASTSSFRGTVAVGAGRSTVVSVPLSAPRAGELQVEVRLGSDDAVVRTVEVRPRGRVVEQARSGTLAAARSFELEGAVDMDPDSARVRVVVSPGALSLLRRELLRVEGSDGTTAGDAHALLLAGAAPALLEALGEPLDDAGADTLRDLALRAGQRVMRHARAPDTAAASLLLPAVAVHPDNPVMQRLADRLADQLAREQRPDGTFLGGGGWTVQRMLVGTADAAAAVQAAVRPDDDASAQRATRVRLAASAAFERHMGQVRDPYTAAAILVSGAVSTERAAELRAIVREGASTRSDGSAVLSPPSGAVRVDGQAPSAVECTALAALALADSAEDAALVADLAATVLGEWRPGQGWGDGRADLLGTRAVTTLLREPLPDEIVVVLERDGVEVTRGVLTGARRSELLVLDAPGDAARGLHTWTVRADPAVPGLGFAMSLRTWVPWPPPLADQGIELQLAPPTDLAVGRRSTVRMVVAAPRNMALEIKQPLPAGVQVDEDSLDLLDGMGLMHSWEVEDGLVTLRLNPQDATTTNLQFDVVPTLAGTVHAPATVLSPTNRPSLVYAVPGSAWTVRR